MSLLRRMLDLLGIARQLPAPVDPDLARTRPKHQRAISKADRVIEDYRRADGVIELRVVRRSR